MGHFDRNNRRGGGGGGFNRRNSGGGRKQMFDATCKKCGDYCQVPFKPTGSKPVFCSHCFEKSDNGGSRNFGGNRFGGKKNFGGSQMHAAVCDKCGSNCEVPFRPTGEKPIYCSDCFGKTPKRGGNNSGGSCTCASEIKKLNEKLDSVLKALGAPETKKRVAPIKVVKKKEEKVEKKTVKNAAKKVVKKAVKKKPAVKKKAAAKKAKPKKAATKKKAAPKKAKAKKKVTKKKTAAKKKK